MYIATAVNVKQRLMPAVSALRDAIGDKANAWADIVKIGRTHMQDATPLTLGQEWSGYTGMLTDDLERIESALQGVYRLALGGTAVGTALSPVIGYDKASKIAHYAMDNDLTLKEAALKLGFVTEDEFTRVVDPVKMVHPYVAKAS
jgi:fumarate hydratase class II